MTAEQSKAYRDNRNEATRKAYAVLAKKYAAEFNALRKEFGFSLKEKVAKAPKANKEAKKEVKVEAKKEVKAEIKK
jgi:hypothetical protein